jgi:hypothetical protein
MKTLPGFSYVMDWDRCGKKGALCEILRGVGARVQVRFGDGTTGVVERMAVRRAKPSEIKMPETEDRDATTLGAHPPSSGE